MTGKLYLSWLALVTVAYLYNAVACTLRPSFVTALVKSKEVNTTWVNNCSTNTTDNSTENIFLNFTDDEINMTQRTMNFTNQTVSMASDNFTMWLALNTSTNTYSTEVVSVTETSQEMNTLLGTHFNATHLQASSVETTLQTGAYNISHNESTSIDISQMVQNVGYQTTVTSMGFRNTSSECWELVEKTYYYYKEGKKH